MQEKLHKGISKGIKIEIGSGLRDRIPYNQGGTYMQFFWD
jgi:hypothetical protein